MRILILSASTGGGHMRASNAMKEYFEKNNAQVTVVDTLKYISPILDKTVTEGYKYLAKRLPNLYKIFYESSNNKAVSHLIFGINGIASKKLLPLINEYEPDVVVTVHPFPNEMMSKLKSMNKTSVPVICVITDYAPHRAWVSENINAYVVANDDMIETMEKMGVDKKIVHSFGIPIDDEFYTKRDKNILLEQMGFNSNIPTVLIMAGSFGVENIVSIYKDLLKIDLEFQIIVITGKNLKLYDTIKSIIDGKEEKVYDHLNPLSRISSNLKSLKCADKLSDLKNKLHIYSKNTLKDDLQEIYPKNTRIIYFTDEVHKYMYIADLIITKPGGLTITESLACNLPMAIFNAIPGQEDENADFLVSKNMAIKLDKKKASSTIKDLLKNREKLEFMKYSCETFDKSESLKNIFDLLNSLVKR